MSRWIKKKDGWHKNEKSMEKGNADYFGKPFPMVEIVNEDGPVRIDWKRRLKEINDRDGITNPYTHEERSK